MPVLNKNQAIFCLSWLSNTNAGATDTVQNLQNGAAKNIGDCLNDKRIVSAIGQFQLAWGPALSTSVPAGFTDPSSSVTDNLLFVAKGTNLFSPRSLYVIAVAGTDPVSSVGWFSEDFDVGSSVPWGTSGGNISAGTAAGLKVLETLPDPSTRQVLLGFLKSALQNEPDLSQVEIAVTGHSLGGALAPVLALFIREALNAWKPGNPVVVSAWPTAGPTPGDAKFASFLTSTLGAANYVSVYNLIDVVPQAWQQDMLSQVPNIYKGIKYPIPLGPSTIVGNAIIQGIVAWALGQPCMAYQRNGDQKPVAFPAKAFSTKDIASIELDATGIMNAPAYSSLRSSLQAILQLQSGNPSAQLKESDVRQLLVFMTEAGYQHTTAYPYQYFGQNDEQGVIAALRQYAHCGLSEKEGKAYDLSNLQALLSEVAAYLKKRSTTSVRPQAVATP